MEQIDDIMAGKEPNPPKDWTPKAKDATKSDGGDAGGAAVGSQHAPTAA
jgi:cell division protease FtsH